MGDVPRPSEPGSFFTHCPLPYYVRLRITANEDALPTILEQRVTAYSVFEAMMQVLLAAGGQALDGQKYVIEEIHPDLLAYLQQFAKQQAIAEAMK